MEGKSSGLIQALGGLQSPLVMNWNRSIGELYLTNGSKVYIDGADDGALRIQGKNLSGAWCDEIGLWRSWDRAWNESLAFAVRIAPGRIVATGTPKIGHPLVGRLIEDPNVPVTWMRTMDNIANLDATTVRELHERYSGTREGEQELEGEYLSDVEGDVLRRDWWQAFPLDWLEDTWRGPPPDGLISSWDTSLKAKTYSDFTVGTLWITAGPNVYLARVFRQRCGLPDAIQAVRDQVAWATSTFTFLPMQVLVENTANGPEIIARLRMEIPGIIPVNPDRDKMSRAQAASVLLEAGNVSVPAVRRGDGLLDTSTGETPAWVAELVDECALFDGTPGRPDDQVDSCSMAWTRFLRRGHGLDWRADDAPDPQPQFSAGVMVKTF
jgi:phage terminase large subunit-like protein